VRGSISDDQATTARQCVFDGFECYVVIDENVCGGGVTARSSIARTHAVYHATDVLALAQPLLADIVWRHVRSMAVVVHTLDVSVCARSSAYGVCDAAAAAVCRVFLREALMAGMEAVYGLTVNALKLVIVLARVHGA
jgi:hypothetical protein